MDPCSKVDYSRHIREALLVVEKLPEIDPPSGRVSGQGLLAIPISGSRRRRNSGEIRDTGFLRRVSGIGSKYRPKGGTGGGPLHPGGQGARPHPRPRQEGAWAPWPTSGSPLWPILPPRSRNPREEPRIVIFTSVPPPQRFQDREHQKTSSWHPAGGRIDLRELLLHHERFLDVP